MRIHPLVEEARRLALACGIDAGKQHDDRERRLQELLLRVEQLGAEHGNLCLVFFLLELSSDFSRLEHAAAWYPTPARLARCRSYCDESSGMTRTWPLKSARGPSVMRRVSFEAIVS